MGRTLNSPIKTKYLIECNFPHYRVGNEQGIVPAHHSCIISGWYFKKGKIVVKGTVKMVSGNGSFIIRNNIIEN